VKAFLIHRTALRREARAFFDSIRNTDGIFVELSVLKKSFGSKWKQQAESKIASSEVVIVYDLDACEESENTVWEIERAKELGKSVLTLSRNDIEARNVTEIQSAYSFSSEFEECFEEESKDTAQILELYKIMVTSSEQLIQRRQITNGFFITVIGAIVGASGLIVKEKVLTDGAVLFLLFPLLIGLMMCRSWANLINNYGKLNAGKFQVIHQLEQRLDAQIFAAEWVALGKGVRKEKYESSTSAKQNLFILFSYLLWASLTLTLLIADYQPVFDFIRSGWVQITQLWTGIVVESGK